MSMGRRHGQLLRPYQGRLTPWITGAHRRTGHGSFGRARPNLPEFLAVAPEAEIECRRREDRGAKGAERG